ncbi:MAG: hypothetical protein ACREXW_18325 [Gammaproteobacteria bacterium]
MKLLTRKGLLIEEQGMSYLADTDPDTALGPLRAVACTYRVALGPRAGQKVLSFQTVPTREPPPAPPRCVDEQGFSLRPEVCCAAHQRKKPGSQGQGWPCWARRGRNTVPLYHPPRHRQRAPGSQQCRQVVLTLKTPYREGTTHIVMSPLEFLQ